MNLQQGFGGVPDITISFQEKKKQRLKRQNKSQLENKQGSGDIKEMTFSLFQA